MTYIIGKNRCKKCFSKGQDKAGNNFQWYGEGKGGYCFACGYTELSDEERANKGLDEQEEYEEEVVTRERITSEENIKIKSYTGNDGKGYRGIKKETNTFFGVRYQYDEETGDVVKQFVPTTINSELVGYRTRVLPKNFSNPIGQVGKEVDMIGEFRFKSHTRTVIITGGEIKMLAAYQMMLDDQRSRGKMDYETIAVVCASIGESAAFKQALNRYEFFSQFSKCVICMDTDTAGEAAAEKLAKVLPRGKVFIMKMRYKDADDYIAKGKEKEFVQDFWNAKAHTPAGIVSSSSIYSEIVERSKQAKLPFPPMLNKLNKMLAGGINYGYIVNILAGSGSGKSSLVNQCVAYWMLGCNEKVLVASLEAEAAEFGENLLSYQIGKKISMIQDRQEKIDFVASPEAEAVAKNLFTQEDGTPRIYLLDDRGDYSKLQEKIEEVIVSCEVRIIVIDVISDVFSGMTIPEIDLWMSWEKKLVKQYNCILVQVAHTRKAASGEKSASQGKAMTEESIIGSGTQYRSAGINIALQRDKTNEDDIIRNTTTVHLLKSRASGETGIACELYYDGDTHVLHDKEEWERSKGSEF
jgi:archaellum biogenesis ATPase FlaH